MEEKNESRINIEDLPIAEQELTAEESKEVKGGSGATLQNGTGLQVQNGATLQLQNGNTAHANNNTYTGTTQVQSGILQ
jgi:hypothetical protein